MAPNNLTYFCLLCHDRLAYHAPIHHRIFKGAQIEIELFQRRGIKLKIRTLMRNGKSRLSRCIREKGACADDVSEADHTELEQN